MGLNHILVNKDDRASVIIIHEKNKHLWDRIEKKRLMNITSDKCDDLQTYAVSEDAIDKLGDQGLLNSIEPVFIMRLMRENRNVNLDVRVPNWKELTNEEV